MRMKKMNNIYKIIEDGDEFCIRAKTMKDAISISENIYLTELKDECEECGRTFNRDKGLKYYHDSIIQSCELLGELKN